MTVQLQFALSSNISIPIIIVILQYFRYLLMIQNLLLKFFLPVQWVYRDAWDREKTKFSLPSDTPGMVQSKVNAANVSEVSLFKDAQETGIIWNFTWFSLIGNLLLILLFFCFIIIHKHCKELDLVHKSEIRTNIKKITYNIQATYKFVNRTCFPCYCYLLIDYGTRIPTSCAIAIFLPVAWEGFLQTQNNQFKEML